MGRSADFLFYFFLIWIKKQKSAGFSRVGRVTANNFLNLKNSGKYLGEIYGVINEHVILKNYKVSILVIHQNMNILDQFSA